jgi:CO/xanthine dehydrogenase Mo-binding subunit/aerobic-type carbon monoxide dehydrogenase small subunit (CoxS/CutS family)
MHDVMLRDMSDGTFVALVVNGAEQVVGTRPGWRLLDVLRDGLGLVGTKEGCDDGTCGTCTVVVDGLMVRACRKDAGEMAGRQVLTIEGLGTAEEPHPLQAAFVAADAVQCGFCTPGMIMASAALLQRDPHPNRAQIVRWLGSNLCRCTGYEGIVHAVESVAAGQPDAPRQWLWSEGNVGGSQGAAPAGSARTDGLDKATGRAVYAGDIAVEGMLHARALRSPHAHAEIVRIDATKARMVPGVEAILTAADVPGRNAYGRMVKDQPVLVESEVRQIGDPIALVVATSPEAAAMARDLIKVEYRLLPAVFSPTDALAEGAPSVHPTGNLLAENWLRSGDIEAGFAKAEVISEATYSTPWNEHAYLEPEAAVAYLDGDIMVVRTPTQNASYHRAEVAAALGYPADRVRIIPTIVGGGFGGKHDISCQCLVAVAAHQTGRPVKIVYSRAESFASTTKRHPYEIHIRSGSTRAGELTALQVDMLADTGAYASSGPGRMIKAFSSASGPYRWASVELHGRVAYSNNTTAGSMRGPATTQVAFALESHMDLIAEQLAIDPLELRLRNRLREGDTLLSGQVLAWDPAYAATIEAVAPFYREALERSSRSRAVPGTLRRGVGVASIWYGIGGGGYGASTSYGTARVPGRAALDLRRDGTVVLRTGAMDLGQGSDTALAMIAAEELGVPFSTISIETGDTSTTPNAGATAGSRVTYFVGNAVRDAALDLKEAVLGTASRMLEQPFGALELREGRVSVRGSTDPGLPLSEISAARDDARLVCTFEGVFDSDLTAFDAASGLAEPYPAYVTATQVAEVEVETKTGDVRVLRVIAAHDVGKPVFVPGIVGQIEGGIAMGVGFALTEEFLPGETAGFKQYRIPRARDVPEVISLLVSETDEAASLQAKGMAECSSMVAAPAIVNAIAHATGERVVKLPVRLRGTG